MHPAASWLPVRCRAGQGLFLSTTGMSPQLAARAPVILPAAPSACMQQPGRRNINQVVPARRCAPAIKLETVPLSVRDMQSSGLSDGISNSPGSMLRVVQPSCLSASPWRMADRSEHAMQHHSKHATSRIQSASKPSAGDALSFQRGHTDLTGVRGIAALIPT